VTVCIAAICANEYQGMSTTLDKLYWRIRGYDSLKTIFEEQVELGQFTVKQVCHLLQALAAKEGLSFKETVGAYAKRGTKISNDLLAVQKDSTCLAWTCGDNPFFTASVVDAHGKVQRHPVLPTRI
jgi:hypothetical protein